MKFSRVSLALFTWDTCPCIKVFHWIRGTGLSLVLLQCFCGGTYHFVRVEVFFQHVTVLAVHIFYIISSVFSLQMFVSDHGWRCILVSVKPDLGKLISTLLKSKAGSTCTAKRYKKEILKFIDYCNFFRDSAGASFSCFVYSYLSFKVYKSSSSYASLVMTHAALMWFHSFDLCNAAPICSMPGGYYL